MRQVIDTNQVAEMLHDGNCHSINEVVNTIGNRDEYHESTCIYISVLKKNTNNMSKWEIFDIIQMGNDIILKTEFCLSTNKLMIGIRTNVTIGSIEKSFNRFLKDDKLPNGNVKIILKNMETEQVSSPMNTVLIPKENKLDLAFHVLEP